MYKECITCDKLGTDCDGANLIALPAKELIEWCKLRKAHLKLSNAKMAELANMPKGTIDRILAGEGTADFRYESIRPLVKALLGGSFEGIPCPDPNPKADAKTEERIIQLEADNARLRKLYFESLEQHREDLQAERSAENFLIEQIKHKQRTNVVLGILLAISLGTILTALIIDKLDPTKGFFWIHELMHRTGSLI